MVRVLFEEEERLTRFTQECILNCFHIELNLSWWDWIEMNMDFGWIDIDNESTWFLMEMDFYLSFIVI